MSADPKIKMTAAEYLVFERASGERHEFYQGDIFAMSGASRKHNIISLNLASAKELRIQLAEQGIVVNAGGRGKS
jgi:hypothetical protein